MSKYKVGDKVRVRSDLVVGKLYYMDDKRESNSFVENMVDFRGKVVKITDIRCGQYGIEGSIFRWTDEMFEPVSKFKVGDYVIGNSVGRYGVTTKGWIGEVTKIDGNYIYVKGRLGCTPGAGDGFCVNPEHFDLYNTRNQKIVITVDGTTTTARLYENDKVVKSAQAKCNPEDKFDFNVGARLAFDRLVGEKTETKEEPSLKLEVGKKYTIKEYEKVRNHRGISKFTWDEIRKAGAVTITRITPNLCGNKHCCNTGYMGEWYFEKEAFECEYIEPSIDGFKVGDRVNWKGHNGTVICLAEGTYLPIGVQFEERFGGYLFHDCDYNHITAGKKGTKNTCRWFESNELKHGEVEKLYNGKVVYINSGNIPEHLTVGKIYTFIDGMGENDVGTQISSPVKSVDELNSQFVSGVKFLEVKE